jgi:hypothetical protein
MLNASLKLLAASLDDAASQDGDAVGMQLGCRWGSYASTSKDDDKLVSRQLDTPIAQSASRDLVVVGCV